MSDYNYDYLSEFKETFESIDDDIETLKVEMKDFINKYDEKKLKEKTAVDSIEYLIERKIRNIKL